MDIFSYPTPSHSPQPSAQTQHGHSQVPVEPSQATYQALTGSRRRPSQESDRYKQIVSGTAHATQPPAGVAPGPTAVTSTSAAAAAAAAGVGGGAVVGPKGDRTVEERGLIMHTTGRMGDRKAGFNPARLTYVNKYEGVCSFPLVDDENTIGRNQSNVIALPCAKISKYHATINKENNDFFIKDRNSSNGVKVNDRLIPKMMAVLLKDQDKIEIGSFTLTFHAESYDDDFDSDSDGYSDSDPDEILDDSIAMANKMSWETERPRKQRVPRPPGSTRQRVRNIGNRAVANPRSVHEVTRPGARGSSRNHRNDSYRYTKLVTILPTEPKYEDSLTIRAEIEAEPDTDFKSSEDIDNINVLKEDYEKLRLAYELSKVFTSDITEALAKSCELMFEILPVDRAVVLLVDDDTHILGTHYVRVREGKGYDHKEICLSSTILRKVYYSRKAVITSDAFEDPILSKQVSVKFGQIRSVICVPLTAHNKVLGILHLDSRDRVNSFSQKDLSLVMTIGNQTAMAIENSLLIKEMEGKAKLTEQLSRFLPPYVVKKMTADNERIKTGGRDTKGTIIFADIRGFTNLSEKSTPGEVVSLLNDYFERLVNIVFKYNGVVDKYIGDALMAAFGTLEHEQKDSEYRAVCAALEFIQAIHDMNQGRRARGKAPISIGVGLNTGELLSGFIGCQQRLEYTCIGDTVNTSSRICSMASENQVLISETTYEIVKDSIRARPIGYKQFKGKVKEVMVYEAISKI